MPMHKSVKPPIKIIHAEVIHSPLSSKKQEILGFLKDCFLLLNRPHPVSTTFCWWPTLGEPVLQTSWAGVQASRTWSMEFLLCGFKSTMGLALRSWGRNTASVLPKAVTHQSSDLYSVSKLFSTYFLAFEMKLSQSPGITMHLPFFGKTQQKQNPGEGFSLSSGRRQGYKKRNADIYSWAIVKLNNAMALL